MLLPQLVRYVLVGLGLNAALYGCYLLLTKLGTANHAAMTVTYCTGVAVGFLLNRRITFANTGTMAVPFLKYIVTYLIGYGVNFVALWWFVEHASIRHEIVQGGVTVTLPLLLFVIQRFWVFSSGRSLSTPRSVGHVS